MEIRELYIMSILTIEKKLIQLWKAAGIPCEKIRVSTYEELNEQTFNSLATYLETIKSIESDLTKVVRG